SCEYQGSEESFPDERNGTYVVVRKGRPIAPAVRNRGRQKISKAAHNPANCRQENPPLSVTESPSQKNPLRETDGSTDRDTHSGCQNEAVFVGVPIKRLKSSMS